MVTNVVQLGNRLINPEEVMPLLTQYQMIPQLLRESLIDQAIAPFTCTSEETKAALQQFFQRYQLNSQVEQDGWLIRYGISRSHVEAIATRPLKIEKFKQAHFSHQVETYFVRRKADLDRAIYSLIRLQDAGVAQELFFRLETGEQTFSDLAPVYSQGPEASTAGVVGPAELGTLHPILAQALRTVQPGTLRYPMRIGEWFVIVRLEKFIPVQFDESMRQRLLQELFEQWLQESIDQLPETDQVWLKPGNLITPEPNHSSVAA